MASRIQLRRDTAANWTSANPILSTGEAGFETDTAKLKIGDGATAWNSLAYFGGDPSAATIATLLGVPTYADLAAANAALAIGQPYFDTALGKLQITTA